MSDYNLPENVVYTEHDEWIRSDDDVMVVGITDYAQEQLGDIVFVEFPEVGATVTQGQPFGVIESVKAVSDLYAPISGEVSAVNDELGENPERVNSDCYGDGWLIAITPSAPDQIRSLMDRDAYAKSIEERED